MQRSMLVFAASATIVLATETCFAVEDLQHGRAWPRAVAIAKRDPATPRSRLMQTAAVSPSRSPVQQALERDSDLAQAVMVRLPPGTNLMESAAGFSDMGQFVSAVSASWRLGIAMRELERRMVRDGMPLLLAIQDMRPTSDYRTAARRAEADAAAMLAPGHATLSTASRKH